MALGLQHCIDSSSDRKASSPVRINVAWPLQVPINPSQNLLQVMGFCRPWNKLFLFFLLLLLSQLYSQIFLFLIYKRLSMAGCRILQKFRGKQEISRKFSNWGIFKSAYIKPF
jgi:hypothetical protein